MSRLKTYIENLNNAEVPRKIRTIKALESMGKISVFYSGVSLVIDSIADCLEEVYPNSWDILFDRWDTSEQTIAKTIITLEFIIHFPSILITNSNNNRHTITDLYIKLDPSTREGFTFSNFRGRRMSATKEEIYTQYSHSHLSTRPYIVGMDKAFDWRTFCLGESEINQALTLLSSRYTEGIFKLFLYQLTEYLKWESLEGVPYNKMSRILNNHSLNSLPPDTLKEYYTKLKRRSTTKEIDFKIVRNSIRVVFNDKFEEFLRISGFHNDYDYDSNLLAKKDSLGNYYKYQFLSSVIDTENLASPTALKKIGFTFRQQRIDFKVIESINPEEDTTFYLHKKIKEYVAEQIERNIETKRFRAHLVKSLDSIKNTPENTGQNRLFMPID